MARKPENTFAASVYRHMPPASELHREKMSNPYRGGTADTWFSGTATDLWVEWKFVHRAPERAPLKMLREGKASWGITPLQKDWLRRRHEEGRNVLVIVGSPEGGVVLRDLEWEGLLKPDAFRKGLRTRAELGALLTTILMKR